MRAKHHQRQRPPQWRGGKPLRAAGPIAGRRFRRAAILGLILLAAIVGSWFAVTTWIHSGRASGEPLASLPAPADRPMGTPAAEPGGRGARSDPEFVSKMNQATDLLARGKPADAAQLLTEVMRLKPENEDVHYNLGLAFARLGKSEEAVQQYQEALRIFPDYAEAHNNLGNALMRLDRNDEAIQHFEQSLRIMSDYASAHNNLGTALRKVGRTNDALAHFQQAVRLNPDYWQAHFNVGTSCLQAGRLSEARDEFETVLRLQPDFKPAVSSLAAIEAQPSGGGQKP